MKDIKRIFLIQTAFPGDVVMSTPLPRALKLLYPEAELDIVLIPQTRILYEHNPHISHIYLFDKRDPLRRWPALIRLIRQLRQRRYDLALSVHISFTSSLIMLLSGAKIRLGYPRQKFTTLSVKMPKGVPVVKRGLLLLKALSDRDFGHQTEIFVPVDTQTKVEAFLQARHLDPGKLVAIAPGSVWATKRWLPGHYSSLVAKLYEYGYQAVAIGGKEDAVLCGRIIEDSRTPAVNAAGELSLLGSAWLIRNCRLLVSNDSAPLHLANAVQTPVLGIFGPTVKSFGCYPFREGDRVLEINLDCRPCGKHGHQSCPRRHFRCMREISPQTALAAALEMLR